MALPDLATLGDFYVHGLAPSVCVAEARPVESIAVSSSSFFLRNHGLTTGSKVTFEIAEADAVLPAPTSALEVYDATRVNANVFTVALAGVAVSLVDAGSGTILVREDIEPKILAKITAWSKVYWGKLRAHKGPFAEPREDVALLICKLVAYDVAVQERINRPGVDMGDLRRFHEWAVGELGKLDAGAAYSGNVPEDATPPLAENGATGWDSNDNGWTSRDANGDRVL